MSIPLPTRSVAISKVDLLSLKSSKVWILSCCSRAEWRQIGLNISLCSKECNIFALSTRFTKTIAWLKGRVSRIWISFLNFFSSITLIWYCFKPCKTSLPSSINIYTSLLFINFFAIILISSGIVALNIITCFFIGVFINISWTWSLIFRSHRTLSHSSITKYLSLSTFKYRFLTKSTSLPGVPITMWGVFF